MLVVQAVTVQAATLKGYNTVQCMSAQESLEQLVALGRMLR